MPDPNAKPDHIEASDHLIARAQRAIDSSRVLIDLRSVLVAPVRVPIRLASLPRVEGFADLAAWIARKRQDT